MTNYAKGKRQWVHAIQDINEAVVQRQRVFELSRLESLGSVCGGLAHDFNNLLTVMGIHGESISDPQERASFFEAQRQAADLTAGMLNAISDLTESVQDAA